jgi:hypothetical protein
MEAINKGVVPHERYASFKVPLYELIIDRDDIQNLLTHEYESIFTERLENGLRFYGLVDLFDFGTEFRYFHSDPCAYYITMGDETADSYEDWVEVIESKGRIPITEVQFKGMPPTIFGYVDLKVAEES